MIENENLKFFITEEIFILDENKVAGDGEEKIATPTPSVVKPANTDHSKSPTIDRIVKEKEPQPIDDLVILVLPMNNQDKELLVNLLKAIEKTETDVKLIDSFSQYNTNFKKLISFGYLNELKHQLDDSLVEFKPFEIDGKQILIAPALSALHNNVSNKKALWECLKGIFFNN